MIDPQAFINKMQAQLEEYAKSEGHDAVSSLAQRVAWGQICEAMNSQIEAPSLPRPLIPMLPDDHPGVLVVVPTIVQAEEFAPRRWAR